MAQTLKDLITKVDAVFLGNLVLTQYQQEAPAISPPELLAQYLVAQMRDLYSSSSSDRENLTRIISNLELTSARLEDVTQYLYELRDAPTPKAHGVFASLQGAVVRPD